MNEIELRRLKDAEQLLKEVFDSIQFTDSGMPRLDSSVLLVKVIMFFESGE